MDKKKTELLCVKVRGVVNEPKTWAAQYFGKFAENFAPDRYKVETEFMFETEWADLRRKLLNDNVEVPGYGQPACGVWINEDFIGDDVGFLKFLEKDGYISKGILQPILNLAVEISKDASDYCPRDLKKCYVCFDVKVNKKNIGRLLFELYSDLMPSSTMKFLGKFRKYEGCPVHRIANNGWFESGRFEKDGSGLTEVRPQDLTNYREGMLSFINCGQSNVKSSQFLVTFLPAPFLDPYQSPFGALLDGLPVLDAINRIKTHYDSPLESIHLVNFTILYVPHSIAVENHLMCRKPVNKPASVWVDDTLKWQKEKPPIFRLEMHPELIEVPDELDEKLTEVKARLFKENEKLKFIANDSRFRQIVESLMEAEKRVGDLGEEEMKEFMKKDVEERWFKILINAASDFDLHYRPKSIVTLCTEEQQEWLQKLSTISDPPLMKLMKHIKNRDLNEVVQLLKRLTQECINIALTEDYYQPYVERPHDIDTSRPFDDDLDKVPSTIKELVLNRACNLSREAFYLFRLTLKHIIQSVSEAKIDERSTLSGDIVMMIDVTRSLLQLRKEEDIEKTKTEIFEEIESITKSVLTLHEECSAELWAEEEVHGEFRWGTADFGEAVEEIVGEFNDEARIESRRRGSSSLFSKDMSPTKT